MNHYWDNVKPRRRRARYRDSKDNLHLVNIYKLNRHWSGQSQELYQPREHEAFAQCKADVDSSSTTLVQHQPKVGSTSHILLGSCSRFKRVFCIDCLTCSNVHFTLLTQSSFYNIAQYTADNLHKQHIKLIRDSKFNVHKKDKMSHKWNQCISLWFFLFAW